MLGDLLAHDGHRLEAHFGGLGRRQRRERFGQWSRRAHRGGDWSRGRHGRRCRGWSWSRNGCCATRGEVGIDVGPGDAAAGAGALHESQIDVVLAGEFADQRADGAGEFLGYGLGRDGCRSRLIHGSGSNDGRRGSSGRRLRICGRRGHLRSRSFGARGSGRSDGLAGRADAGDDGIDGDDRTLLDQDLGEDALGGGGDFRIDLVGGDFEERLVALDGVADLLEPLGQRAFDNALAHLGHHNIGHGVLSIRSN